MTNLSIDDEKTKVLALFLPQFHDDPFNDEWWGKGFNEWVNVRKARSMFPGHVQPKEPVNDNYYKLDTAQEIDSQINTARAHGVDGFVWYHYWSKGTRLLKKPLDIFLSDQSIGRGSEFSLCWANHSWTRSWKNRKGAMDVLLEQGYETTETELKQHVKFLVGCFTDPRYVKLKGEPVFFLYHPENIPNLPLFVDLLRAETAKELGVDCHISGIVTSWQKNWDFLEKLSSATMAQPALSLYGPVNVFSKQVSPVSMMLKPSAYTRSLPMGVRKFLYPIQDALFNRLTYWDYNSTWKKLLEQMEAALSVDRIVHFGTFVDFDNTARYGNRAKLFRGFSPESFQSHFEQALELARKNTKSGLLLVNAWNEWAEGMYLQADKQYGNTRLEAVKNARLNVERKMVEEVEQC